MQNEHITESEQGSIETRLARLENRLMRIETKTKPVNYQGWSTFESWAVSLWMDHDARQYLRMKNQAEQTLIKHDGDKEQAAYAFADSLKEEMEKGVPSNLKGVYLELLEGALSQVDYGEIARYWMADIECPAAVEKPERAKAVDSRSGHTLTASAEVLEVLRNAVIDDEGLTLTGELQRDQYEAVNLFLGLAGAKWNKSKRRHIFKGNAKERIEALIAGGTIEDEKKKYQAFYTPSDLAIELADLAGIEQGMTVLEPSAGAGAIADAAKAMGAIVSCVEVNPDAAGELEAKGYDVNREDFLSLTPDAAFDRVLMNPPFSKHQDIKHIRHAYGFLKEGGKLLAIMSPGFTFGDSKIRSEFRDFLAERGRIVKEVDAGAFAESGTQVRTIIVELTKTQQEQPDLFTAA